MRVCWGKSCMFLFGSWFFLAYILKFFHHFHAVSQTKMELCRADTLVKNTTHLLKRHGSHYNFFYNPFRTWSLWFCRSQWSLCMVRRLGFSWRKVSPSRTISSHFFYFFGWSDARSSSESAFEIISAPRTLARTGWTSFLLYAPLSDSLESFAYSEAVDILFSVLFAK